MVILSLYVPMALFGVLNAGMSCPLLMPFGFINHFFLGSICYICVAYLMKRK